MLWLIQAAITYLSYGILPGKCLQTQQRAHQETSFWKNLKSNNGLQFTNHCQTLSFFLCLRSLVAWMDLSFFKKLPLMLHILLRTCFIRKCVVGIKSTRTSFFPSMFFFNHVPIAVIKGLYQTIKEIKFLVYIFYMLESQVHNTKYPPNNLIPVAWAVKTNNAAIMGVFWCLPRTLVVAVLPGTSSM